MTRARVIVYVHSIGGAGKGGKNRRRGKNEGESKRELEYKEPGQE